MTKNILIDKLPTKMWNFLKVNSAEIQWDSESAAKTEENIILKKDEKNEPVRLDNSGAEGYTEKVVNVTAEKAARGVIFEVCRGNAPMLSRVNIDLEEGAEVKLVMLLEPSENGLVHHVSAHGIFCRTPARTGRSPLSEYVLEIMVIVHQTQ